MRVLVIGGNGSSSTRVTQKALERSHDVMVCARGRRPLLDGLAVRWQRADRAELRAQASELAAFDPEVVVDSICFDPARAEDPVALFGAARRVVLISSDAAEQPSDGALVEPLVRHAAELGELRARRAAAR
jgi:nucleoside-diphosphate-sugar epimerase